uniref:Uncharacterized protein n=1 Tax=Megaselia scalaris TaxID=36166 RepID=T1GB67_MEGSC
METGWKQWVEVVKTTATEIIGMEKPQRPSSWRDEEYDIVAAEKDVIYQKKRPEKHECYEEDFEN